MTITVVDGKPRPQPAWLIAGLLLMAYAVIGNWLALPGYRRFLAQGHQSSNGGADLSLILGASKTILWMLSFHLGAFCLAWAALVGYGALTVLGGRALDWTASQPRYLPVPMLRGFVWAFSLMLLLFALLLSPGGEVPAFIYFQF